MQELQTALHEAEGKPQTTLVFAELALGYALSRAAARGGLQLRITEFHQRCMDGLFLSDEEIEGLRVRMVPQMYGAGRSRGFRPCRGVREHDRE